ncbi:MAG TPA: dinitrogenase iron-molybdenum cofactor biosynthesis protein [Candidatus Bathyarchaeota archaeon]|nr:dinitrogenase iron-molybdenum cofactor biosynthesis protein [Candidatus Bathyarchaeota archaeon]
MKICVSASSDNLDAEVDSRFGRCPYFVIVDSETMEFNAVSNDSTNAAHGAGIQAAQTVVNMGVNVVITGNVGPNAFNVLSASGIRIVTGASGSVREAVEKYKKGQLKEIGNPTVGGHFGMGGGRGRGRSNF